MQWKNKDKYIKERWRLYKASRFDMAREQMDESFAYRCSLIEQVRWSVEESNPSIKSNGAITAFERHSWNEIFRVTRPLTVLCFKSISRFMNCEHKHTYTSKRSWRLRAPCAAPSSGQQHCHRQFSFVRARQASKRAARQLSGNGHLNILTGLVLKQMVDASLIATLVCFANCNDEFDNRLNICENAYSGTIAV